MADYSEFPTTPTAWQEQHAAGWEVVTPLDSEEVLEPRRRVDPVALVAGVLFAVLAIALWIGAEIPEVLFREGGLFWIALVGIGETDLFGDHSDGGFFSGTGTAAWTDDDQPEFRITIDSGVGDVEVSRG